MIGGFTGLGTWYHGSQQRLTRLRAGSSITQNRPVAKAFSRPSLVSMSASEEGKEWSVRHNGATPGYLICRLGRDRSW